MKAIFLTLIFLQTTVYSLFSQGLTKQLHLAPINANFIGTYVNAAYKINSKKHSFCIGISYLINPPEKGKWWSVVFLKKAYASNFLQHWMPHLGYERSFKFKESATRLFSYAELMVAHTKMKRETYQGYITFNDVSRVYEFNYVYDEPNFSYIVGHIGLGLDIPLSSKISLQQQVGFMPSLVLYRDSRSPNLTKELFTGTSDFHYSFSLNYTLP